MNIQSNNYQKTLFTFAALLVVAGFFVFSTSPAHAASVWYVATNGTDNSSCGSTTSPCASIQYVLANKVAAGDTVKIKAGTYNIPSGSSGNHKINNVTKHQNITITAEDPNNRPLLKFYGNTSNPFTIEKGVKGVTISYLKIDGGSVTRGQAGLIRVDDNPTVLDHLLIYNGCGGIYINTAKRVTVSNSVVHTQGLPETDPNMANQDCTAITMVNFGSVTGDNIPATGWNEKTYIYNNEVYTSGDGFIPVDVDYKYIEVAYNNFHDNWEDGIDMKNVQYLRIHHNKLHDNWGAGIMTPVKQYALDIEIYNNEIYNNGWAGITCNSESPGLKQRWKIYNNLIYNNAIDPTRLPPWEGYGINMPGGQGHEIYHNTVYNNGNVDNSVGKSGGGILAYGAIIKNNIIYNNNGRKGNIAAGTADHNYVYPTSPGTTGTNAITVSDPKMADPANANFILLSSSPLIDAGINVGITNDYIGTSRPQGAGYDIGAYEYPSGGSGDITPPSAPTGVTVS